MIGDRGGMEYDLGYIVHHTHWNKGCAIEAAEVCKQYAIEKFGTRLERTFRNPKNRDVETLPYALAPE